MKETYTKKELVKLLSDLSQMATRQSEESKEVNKVIYFSGKASAYAFTACFLTQITLKEDV